ncbi:succinate dehydrogenase [ubiquinone] cytochrome b small subunit, mitochondrial [Sitophilus oryzae]|uniref:Succinate dehydrogenase [ubiquinone] cytochrome b small subunit n=1 Tax=Sitophilus oryzae TaxID=7048 RepID=A0A6J2YHD6_SITOR|nr:succinate dehydrogenase [ubiquinone] cytochrome b small subunit, mitochondrial [Sitophilus oryzae]
MALSLMLRNGTKLRGIAGLQKCTFNVQKTQNFTQFLNQDNYKTLSLVNKCKTQFINVAQQSKRNMSADHGKLWTLEKIVSLALLGIVPATFLFCNPLLDDLFALATVIHFHWGLEACVIDYIRPIIVGPVLPKIALLLLYVISATTLGGLLYFNHTQIGIGRAFRQFWCISE